ncbi:Uncharacterised protein [Mycobacteroides abscessus]|uniref:hypothetical protein n=1 Tax=Mycobacteroides abscessus TaxID=36809 RepID=UPI0005E87E57|nr:hypothetical protein [Mycobacteroides abscessus]CPU55751.1 Uncharacterised protein [Mycobacteroides abscessus]CPU57729.1 Uncharacterised protein [Mycobacteroides abscessus]CPU59147.1 Uncharacterised protein [Mycobacteroides abscessus]CPV61117.1 Uncharacterised protein [Mycobacteroides abscessus]
MTVAVRLPNGTTIVPVKLERSNGWGGGVEKVVESASVHAMDGYVVLDPGAQSFTVQGPTRTETLEVFKHFERIANVPELPETVGSEAHMDELRGQWENVDAFYRRVVDKSTHDSTPSRTCDLAEMRVLDVAVSGIPDSAMGWSPSADYLGVPAPLSAVVPGTLGAVPDLIVASLTDAGLRASAGQPRPGQSEVQLTVEFEVAFSDARKKLVKKNPLNNRRDAKRIAVTDTKYVRLTTPVPITIAADSLAAAHAEVERIVIEIRERVDEPVTACAACGGSGLVFSSGIRERY